jgi:hypothetical protein
MSESSITYFDAPGSQNTESVLDVVAERIKKGGIKHVVVASDSGETGKKMLSRLNGTGVKLIIVTEACGSEEEGKSIMEAGVEKSLRESGATIVQATHALSGVERSINKKIGGASRVETIAEALRALFGHGMKVCVEIVIMAADNAAIPCGEIEVIAVAGSSSGADTACVVRPAHANGFFNFQVREVLAMPRKK